MRKALIAVVVAVALAGAAVALHQTGVLGRSESSTCPLSEKSSCGKCPDDKAAAEADACGKCPGEGAAKGECGGCADEKTCPETMSKDECGKCPSDAKHPEPEEQ